MIYLDNAATSRFKPPSVFDSLKADILNGANSGRSGHKDSINAALKIENCRALLRDKLGFDRIIFTKSCTEALNLAIFSAVKGGERVVTASGEHNAVLRPLYHLKRQGLISLDIIETQGKRLSAAALKEHARGTDIFVIGGASNVTGTSQDIGEIGKIAKDAGAMLIVDGAQSVPLIEADFANADMLACPGHKGLHGIQGTGFLAVKESITLKPLIYGGTGSRSIDENQPSDIPEGLEAGTLFSGGIAALSAGASWTYGHLDAYGKNVKQLAELCAYNLKSAGCRVYSDEFDAGIVLFNISDMDSTQVADILNEHNIAVRAGLHCAPLMHKSLGTLSQGGVRVSIGADNTKGDIAYLSRVVESILRAKLILSKLEKIP